MGVDALPGLINRAALGFCNNIMADKPKRFFPQKMIAQPRWMNRKPVPGTSVKRPYSAHTECPADYVPDKDEKPGTWRWRWRQACLCATYLVALASEAKDAAIDGLNFVFHPFGDKSKRKRLIFIDLDDCNDEPFGAARPNVQVIVDTFGSYTEYSLSGKGLHIVVETECEPFTDLTTHQLPGGGAIEVHCQGQCAMTGIVYEAEREVAEVPFSLIESLPFFKHRASVSTATDFNFAEWWDQALEPIGDEHAEAAEVMRNWEAAIRAEDDPCDSHKIMHAAACELMRFGIVGWPAYQLLSLVPTDAPWTEKELKHKLEDAYAKTQAEFDTKSPPSRTAEEFGLVPISASMDDWGSNTESMTAASREEFPPTELLMFPGFVEKFAEWHAARSRSANKRYGAIGGIAVLSLLMARRIFNEDGTSPVIYLLVLGSSGTGKTEMITSIHDFFLELGMSMQVIDSFTSAPALEDALMDQKAILTVIDEAHNFYTTASGVKDSHLATSLGWIKKIYSSSRSVYQRRLMAAKRDKFGATPISLPEHSLVDKPHHSSIQCAPPLDLYSAFDPALFRDGTMARLNQIEVLIEEKPNRFPVDETELKAFLVDRAKSLLAMQPPLELMVVNVKDGVANIGIVTPFRFSHDQDSKELNYACQQQWHTLGNQCALQRDEMGASFYRRLHEQVCKYELLIAGSAFDPTKHFDASAGKISGFSIQRQQTQRALDIVLPSFQQKYKAILNSGGDDKYWADVEKIERLARDEEHNGWFDWTECVERVRREPERMKKIVQTLYDTNKLILVSGVPVKGKQGQTYTKKVLMTPERYKQYQLEKSEGQQ